MHGVTLTMENRMSAEQGKDPNGRFERLGLEPGDSYFSEEGYLVFTEQYHLKRGYCCESGCRHCPYKKGTAKKAAK